MARGQERIFINGRLYNFVIWLVSSGIRIQGVPFDIFQKKGCSSETVHFRPHVNEAKMRLRADRNGK